MNAVEKGSLVDRLQRRHAEARSADKSLTLSVPGWGNPGIRVKYVPVEWEKLADLLEQAADKPAADALGDNLTALGEACAAILVVEDGVERSLADVLREQGEAIHGEVTFATVADVLGLQIEDPATGVDRAPETRDEAILALFAGAVSPELAATEHAGKLGGWMTGRYVEADEETLGN